MPSERTMTTTPLSDDTKRKIVQMTDRRPDFVSARMAAVIERASLRVCQRVLEQDRTERKSVRFG